MATPDASLCDVLVVLRRSYRRLRLEAATAGAAVLILFPLVYTAALPLWQAGLLLAGVLVYLVQKGFQCMRSHRAIAQLRLEEQFVTHSFSTEQFVRCLARRDHFWQRSRTLQVLQRVLPRTAPDHLADAVNRQRLPRLYRQAFASMRFRRVGMGLPLALLLILGGAGAAGTLPRTVPLLWLAAVALPVLLLAEGRLFVDKQDLHDRLCRLERALSAWTLRMPLRHARRRHRHAPYRHTPVYQAPAWRDVADGPPASTET